MVEKKQTRSARMYANSPKMERNAEGKMAVSKKGPDVAGGNSSDGISKKEMATMDLGHKHAKERLELTQKHEMEHHAMMSKHMKEGSPAEEKGETVAEEKKETKAEVKAEKEKGVK